ncbi:sensor histidine kinase [Rhodococcus sp. NPDC058505]|uniref:sensor histidine kinase n=1 Tax=unclassified Rhodococcus (in: high G+C Gram-positive bacteria) TaxID=192944 RepID=UPI003657B154
MTAASGAHRGATDRILRTFAVFTGVGYLFYLLLLLPSVIGQADRLDRWWTPVATLAVFGSGIAFGLSALSADSRTVRRTAGVAAVLFLVALGTGMVAWHGPDLTDGQGVWLSAFPGVASLAAVAAWRPVVAFGHMIIASAGVQIFNALARDPRMTSPLIPDIAFSIMFCTLFVGAAVMALRTGRVLDSTLDATHAAAAAAAARHARTVERARFDAMIHDGVMSTLLAASRQGTTPSLSAQAERTLRQFDALRAGPAPDDRFDVTEIVSHLRTATGDVDDHIDLDVRRAPGHHTLTMPAEAARAVGAALAESLRNSVRHADPGAERGVTVTVGGRSLTVEVSDSGPGFDPKTVPAHRLGLAVSILGRMRQLPGGSAAIDSQPDAGTRVRLSWSAQ